MKSFRDSVGRDYVFYNDNYYNAYPSSRHEHHHAIVPTLFNSSNDSFADYVTADQMAATPAAVYALLDEIWTPALDRAKEELAAMEEMLRADHPDATFEPWDWWLGEE